MTETDNIKDTDDTVEYVEAVSSDESDNKIFFPKGFQKPKRKIEIELHNPNCIAERGANRHLKADDRQIIIGKVVDMLADGLSDTEIRKNLRYTYGIQSYLTQCNIVRYAISQLQSVHTPKKALSIILSRCERIYNGAVEDRDWKNAYEVTKLVSKLMGVIHNY